MTENSRVVRSCFEGSLVRPPALIATLRVMPSASLRVAVLLIPACARACCFLRSTTHMCAHTGCAFCGMLNVIACHLSMQSSRLYAKTTEEDTLAPCSHACSCLLARSVRHGVQAGAACQDAPTIGAIVMKMQSQCEMHWQTPSCALCRHACAHKGSESELLKEMETLG